MNQKQGPYKHYERPTEPRSSGEQSSSKGWIAIITILIIIIIALVPIVHRLASDQQPNNQVTQLQTTKKAKKVPKHKVKKNKKAKKNKLNKAQSSLNNTSSMKKQYVVKSGDTLSSIASKHGMSVKDLTKLNNLNSMARVDAGQTLKLK
ncbi:LysM peptidoglycan-binding domain-containing protein [Lactobacillus acetotolerans]|jgi:LysM repeat protein|uniref:LysM peptidoglycan-binding domain-containing protein n=1 Tax=Lactobacillus acetotolerans TaxID=1600 RepID=UPI0019CFFA4A|nr:LysM domain-containing protein [Lactobacillus acetotolerans]MBN7276003.1 LysM peptidoglycan-binding domain-containing protein [Lactobacillus acetotolerans]